MADPIQINQDPASKKYQVTQGGKPVTPQYTFEQEAYDNPEAAATAAEMRMRYNENGSPKGYVDRPQPKDWRTQSIADDYVAHTQAQEDADISKWFDEYSQRGHYAAEAPKGGGEKPKPAKDLISLNPIEYGKQTVSAGINAALETLGFIHDAGNWLRQNTPLKGGPIVSFGANTPEGQKKGVTPGAVNFGAIQNPISEPTSVVSEMYKNVAQFLIGMAGAGKVLKGAKVLQGAGKWTKFSNMVVSGAMSDAIAFDPHDPTVMRSVEQLLPDWKVPLVQYLANHDEDTRAEARLKRTADSLAVGLITGATVEAFMSVAKGLKTGQKARQAGVPLENAAAAEAEAKAASGTTVSGQPSLGVEAGSKGFTMEGEGVTKQAAQEVKPNMADVSAQQNRGFTMEGEGVTRQDPYIAARQQAEQALETYAGPGLPTAAQVAENRVLGEAPSALEAGLSRRAEAEAARASIEKEVSSGFGDRLGQARKAGALFGKDAGKVDAFHGMVAGPDVEQSVRQARELWAASLDKVEKKALRRLPEGATEKPPVPIPVEVATRQIADDILQGTLPRELSEAVKRGETLDLGQYGKHGYYTMRTLDEASVLAPGRPQMDYISERLPVLTQNLVRQNPEATALMAGAQQPNVVVQIPQEITNLAEQLIPGAGKALPELLQGFVRLFRGEGPQMVQAASKLPEYITENRGRWFSTSAEKARSYGPNLKYVDVPEEVAQATGNVPGAINEHLLPAEWADKAVQILNRTALPKTLAGVTATTALGSILGDFGVTDEEKNQLMTAGLGDIVPGVAKWFQKYMREAAQRGAQAAETAAPGSEVASKISKYIKPEGVPEFSARPKTTRPNMDYIEADPDVKRLWKNVYREIDQKIEDARRGIVPVDETDKAAWEMIRSGQMNYEKILSMPEGQAFKNAEEGRAARILEATLYEHGDDLAKRFTAGEELPPGELRRWFALAQEISPKVNAGAKAEPARAVRNLQEPIKGIKGYDISVDFDRVQKLADAMDPRMGDAELAEAMTRFVKEPPQQMSWARAAWAAKGDLILELMYGAMLSGKALTKNPLGNALYAGIAIADRAIEANIMTRIGGMLGKDTKTWAQPGEATQMAYAFWETLVEQGRLWGELGTNVMRRDLAGVDEVANRIAAGGAGKFANPRTPAWSSARLNLDPNDMAGKVVDIWGRIWRTGPTVLNLQDSSFQVMNARMAMRAKALREASAEGFQGPALFSRMEEKMLEPSVGMVKEANYYRAENTFTKDFEARWAQNLQQAVANAPVQVGVLPFFKTLVRIAEAGATHTPGLNLLTTQYWNMMKRGGRDAAEAQAKLLTGAGFIGTAYWLASQGLATGSVPSDKRTRELYSEAKWQPTSLYNPQTEKYYSLAGLEPFSTFFTIGSDLQKYAANAKEPVQLQHLFWSAVVSQVESIVAQPFAMGLSRALEVVKSPTPDKAMAQLSGIVQQFYPAAAREVTRAAVDNTKYEAPRYQRGEEPLSLTAEFNMLMRQAMRSVPGYGGIPERNSVTGKVEVTPGSIPWVPSQWSELAGNASVEVARLAKYKSFPEIPDAVGPGKDPTKVDLGGPADANQKTRLNDDEKDRWKVIMTSTKIGGLNLEQSIDRLMANPDYSRMTDERKALQLWQIGNGFKKKAYGQLLNENEELRNLVTDAAKSKGQKMKLQPRTVPGINMPGLQ